jgi:hypothetical protein
LAGRRAAISTTLGTRGTLSAPNTPITSNANAEWKDYARDPDYPDAVTLPLQFIDTREGGTLAVLVSVPADADGNPVPGRFPTILTQTAYRVDVGALIGGILPLPGIHLQPASGRDPSGEIGGFRYPAQHG